MNTKSHYYMNKSYAGQEVIQGGCGAKAFFMVNVISNSM